MAPLRARPRLDAPLPFRGQRHLYPTDRAGRRAECARLGRRVPGLEGAMQAYAMASTMYLVAVLIGARRRDAPRRQTRARLHCTPLPSQARGGARRTATSPHLHEFTPPLPSHGIALPCTGKIWQDTARWDPLVCRAMGEYGEDVHAGGAYFRRGEGLLIPGGPTLYSLRCGARLRTTGCLARSRSRVTTTNRAPASSPSTSSPLRTRRTPWTGRPTGPAPTSRRDGAGLYRKCMTVAALTRLTASAPLLCSVAASTRAARLCFR